MINAPAQGIAQPQSLSIPTLRPGPRLFWALCALLGVVLAAVLMTLIMSVPAPVPLARSADAMTVRDAVLARLNGAAADPLIELAPGVTARQSNIRGLSLGGRTYYYYVDGQPRFDPLARGVLVQDSVEVVLRDERGSQPLVIYTVITP
jgi:hypothetical protein